MADTDLGRSASAWRDVRMLRLSRGPIEVATAGEGIPMLVVHGTPGSWRQCFSLAEDLADRCLVIAPSRPGYGRTPLSTGRTYDEQADAYAAILDALDVERAFIVGASGGGPSALSFAQNHADRCLGLVLACAVNSSMMRIPPMLRYVLAPRGVGEVVSRIERRVSTRRLADAAAVDKWMEKSLTPDEHRRAMADRGLREDLIAFAYTHLEAPAALGGIRNDLLQVRLSKTLTDVRVNVRVPSLILHGTADDVVPFAQAEHHQRLIPGAQLEAYEDAGHVFFFTRRKEVAERIRRFVDETVGARGDRR